MPNTKKSPHKTHKKWGKNNTTIQFRLPDLLKTFIMNNGGSKFLLNLIYEKYSEKTGKERTQEDKKTK
jgi:hypothetical protein